MKNLWSDRDAESCVRRYAKAGVARDLALRVYTTRLLGGEPRLVLHGGGNTSVKTRMRDLAGADVGVLCVKGSGWDMATIEPEGLPAVRLEPLLGLLKLEALSDEDMVNVQRGNLIDSASPNPSVETLLHAFIPHAYIDHTHSNAVLALTDQPDPERLCREVYGDRMGDVPYIMPGFALATKAAEVYRRNPGVEGLILLKHGIFTFGRTAKEAYGRMIGHVSHAEARIAKSKRKIFAARALPKKIASPAEVAPILRGLLAIPVDPEARGRIPVRDKYCPPTGAREWKRLVLDFRNSPEVRAFVDGKDVARYGQAGTATPDHVIRTKQKPLIVPAPEAGKLDAFKAGASQALAKYVADYRAYFARNNKRFKGAKKELDPIPRVVLVPGLGLFGLGESLKAAKIAADLAETNVEVIANAEALGRYRVIPEPDTFDVEYWSLEQAKLGKGAEKPLARHVVAVTGGGSGIGAATAKAFAAAGAEVCVLDRDAKAAETVAKAAKGLAVACDVTDPASVRAAFDRIAASLGGVDVVVSNAGAAWQGRIGDVDDATLRKSFELNFFAHQAVAQNAVRIMRAQGLGGCLLFNTSKQAINPGRDFGPYGLPKAATLFLMKQYALDHGAEGIRSNAVNADRIRSGLLTEGMIAQRSKARGLSARDYMAGNLLRQEVTAEDVAREFVAIALAKKTTAAIVTVDGGNIEA
ncbi:MAG: bifunctional aldolase/short-chain dehydrogenase, partial [Rhodospirillales bacterium]|nr:bifunctional aldolase/short-chain dehydrogenase [Rhodospirillales bacterium]